MELIKAGCDPFIKERNGLRADEIAEYQRKDTNIHLMIRTYMNEKKGEDVEMT